MNSIDVRTEKANAIFRYRYIQRFTTLFRFMEMCVFLVVIRTFSSQLPFSVRVSVDSFKGISFASFSPKFVFVIGNMIVLFLLFKSRVAENGDRNGKIDVYDECVKRCEKSVVNSATDSVAIRDRTIYSSQSEKMMRIECKNIQSNRKLTRSVTERKMLKNVDCCGGNTTTPEICRIPSEKMMRIECKNNQSHRKLTRSVSERKMLVNVDCCGSNTPTPEICRIPSEKMMTVEYKDDQSHRKLTQTVNVNCSGGETQPPEICRSSSEKMMTVACEDDQSCRKLTRSVTEKKILKDVNYLCSETPEPENCGVDELSNEAFRRAVEAFIAKQQRSLRDEELAPVPYVGA